MKLAVVGAGPKALFCLERLAAEIDRRPITGFEVHVFDPYTPPGAGPNYDPAQPEVLRMNLANRAIDLWSPPDAGRPARARTYMEYEADAGRKADPHAFASRASVGRYLADGFEEVVAVLRRAGPVRIRHETVLSIEQSRSGFALATQTAVVEVDEVLIATGHASQLNRTRSGSNAAVYPITRTGGVLDIAADSDVRVRGMGLTAIDAVMAMTEGRGGTFSARGDHMYCYRRGTDAVDRISIGSRTNRPMVPKPTRPVEIAEDDHQRVWTEACSRIVRLDRSDAPVEDLRQTLAAATDAVMCAMQIEAPPAEAELDRLLAREALAPDAAVTLMRLHTDVACGRGRPTTSSMLGTTWRRCYPAIVALAATRSLDETWPDFWRIATEMEPLAFGPPPDTAARLCALLDAGVLTIAPASGTLDEPEAVRFDAVLDAPGIVPAPSPLIQSLLDAGLATRRFDTFGLAVTPDGTCFGRCGGLTAGLAAVGRPTEGSVLGNDTLDRRLHDVPARWAAAIIDRYADAVVGRQEQP